ncbi:MAG: MoxR family ATPase [Candidatus Promineifilaceae bacterium]
MAYTYSYTGDFQPGPDDRKRGVQPYKVDYRLKNAVELTMQLGRPLLLQGEPGCGKTQLAFHLAYELGRLNKLPEGEDWPLEIWPVQSISRARDGIYTYDAIGRLSNAQLAYLQQEESKKVSEFIKYGALGNAIRQEKDDNKAQDKRVIVLIDEIDKADIDFPNDLLWVLDKQEFQITEFGSGSDAWLKADPDRRPIIIITSNREKELPGPFLRRCLYHFIEFPGETTLNDILAYHFPDLGGVLRSQIVKRFFQVRTNMEERTIPGKLISTSELIDWAKALQIFRDSDQIMEKLAEMENDLNKTPHKHVLFKSQEQFEAYQDKD